MPKRRVSQAVREAWISQWVHLVPEVVQRLDELAAREGRSRFDLFREIVREYLDRLEASEVAPPTAYRGDMSLGRYPMAVPIPRRDAQRAEKLAKQLKVSKAAIYREAVRRYLQSQGVEVEP